MSDMYLRSTADKPQVISLRSQDQKVAVAAEPLGITLSSILLAKANVGINASPDDLILSNIILGETAISGVIVPNDIVMSSIILGQTRQPTDIEGTMSITITGKAPSVLFQGAL